MSKKLSVQEKARRLWVRALRSGKYKWGKEELHPGRKFCCLGVLCEVGIKHKVITSYKASQEFLPSAVMDWAGLTSDNGEFDDGDNSLTTLNDYSKRNPFKKIAKLIERKPEGLFVKEQE